jgi:hypothetical protein
VNNALKKNATTPHGTSIALAILGATASKLIIGARDVGIMQPVIVAKHAFVRTKHTGG